MQLLSCSTHSQSEYILSQDALCLIVSHLLLTEIYGKASAVYENGCTTNSWVLLAAYTIHCVYMLSLRWCVMSH